MFLAPDDLAALTGRVRAAAQRRAPDRLYADLFQGHEPRALVTLEPAHARRAVQARAVTREVAQASVLVAYRTPGAGACIVAIPRERYDGLGVLGVFSETTGGQA